MEETHFWGIVILMNPWWIRAGSAMSVMNFVEQMGCSSKSNHHVFSREDHHGWFWGEQIALGFLGWYPGTQVQFGAGIPSSRAAYVV